MVNKQTFEPLIAGSISKGLIWLLGGENVSMGMQADEHKCEGYVQEKIASLLSPVLPSPTLLTSNEMLVEDVDLGRCIPDILIQRLGGGHWDAFELKTLMRDDQLNVAAVNEDLLKLCAYKRSFPAIAAVFVLVGSRAKLFNVQRKVAWTGLKINYEPASFVGPRPQPQALDTPGFVALPCGSYNVDGVELCVFMWEVVPQGNNTLLSATYRFAAEMA